jgi:cytochrome c peroxidase
MSTARRALALLAYALAAAASPVPAAARAALDDAERAKVLSHGPWPAPWTGDPSNRVSGKRGAIAFGERLFFDTRLSKNGLVSCAACHQPKKTWTDGHARGIGLAVADRNTPSIANVRYAHWFGWDGAHDNLWAQSIRPILDPREMGMTPQDVAKVVRDTPMFSCHYRKAFGQAPPPDDIAVLVGVAKGLAAFQETVVTARTPFDDFRDALARNDAAAMARYPAPALRGLKLFVGRGQCTVCHAGPLFTNGEFGDIGVGFFVAQGTVDPGRHEGIRKLHDTPYNLLGKWNDDASRKTATGTRHVSLEHRNFGEFKVPGLRGVAETAPYMHNGSVKTLRDAVRHYSELDPDRVHSDGEQLIKPLRLTDGEIDDLVAFLTTLSGPTPDFRRQQTVEPDCN